MRKKNINLEDVLSDRFAEEDLVEVPLSGFVFKIALVCVVICFVVIFGKFLYINIFEKDIYGKRAESNINDVIVQFAPRGIILDRFGNPLLHNEPTTKIFFSPRDFPKDPNERIGILKKIAEAAQVDELELVKKIKEKDWYQSDQVLLFDDATNEQVVNLSALNIQGLRIEPSFKRVHEEPFVFSHLLGYTGLVNTEDLEKNNSLFADDEIGRAGLESYYDEYLRGENGEEVIIRDASGNIIEKRDEKEPSVGKSIETFIDKNLQEFMYNRLQGALIELGRDAGVAVAMNPKNGEVLALVNIPSYDVLKISKYLSYPNNPFFNRAVGGLYTPGSVIKPLVGTAALAEKVITPEKQIFSAGYIEIPNPYYPDQPSRFLDWKPNGWIDIRSALAKSSNIYFYEVSGGFENQKGIGILKLKEWWQKFLLDKKTGIDITGEREGFLPDPEWKEKNSGEQWRLGDTYNVSIGQGDFMVTPIELLSYISAVANGGVLYKPRIMMNVRGEDNVSVASSTIQIQSDISDQIKEAIPYIREGMRDVVRKSYGTATSLNALPFSVAAKTGTSQVQNNTKVNALFVGFGPYEDPEIAILILVENAREGSLNTIPVAKDIFMWYYENRLSKK